ncbi:outer membrane lipid asymmetry maintenance protein MlaD [Halospina denitrificans]|uniref:outer membrane lipid asymmetry maintenance protein MlaD n=1 Tax=Halospina denitrificans TaxID=332522 RepID=UPI0014150539|nr:outer membrane lipid asymmetry maintenance protein MlaD [Halospina denitrificans]
MKERLVFFVLGVVVTLSLLLLSGVFPEMESADSGGTYQVFAEFSDVGTLKPGSRVAMAGVTIGKVTRVELDTDSYRARVAMEVREDVDRIAIDSSAVIRTAGLMGEHYIEISPGGHPDSISDNDYIEDTQSAISIEALILRRITGG